MVLTTCVCQSQKKILLGPLLQSKKLLLFCHILPKKLPIHSLLLPFLLLLPKMKNPLAEMVLFLLVMGDLFSPPPHDDMDGAFPPAVVDGGRGSDGRGSPAPGGGDDVLQDPSFDSTNNEQSSEQFLPMAMPPEDECLLDSSTQPLEGSQICFQSLEDASQCSSGGSSCSPAEACNHYDIPMDQTQAAASSQEINNTPSKTNNSGTGNSPEKLVSSPAPAHLGWWNVPNAEHSHFEDISQCHSAREGETPLAFNETQEKLVHIVKDANIPPGICNEIMDWAQEAALQTTNEPQRI